MTLAQQFVPDIAVDELQEHPENPRRGDDDAVGESIDTNGFWGGILVQRSTGYILGGNTRYRAMVERGETTIPGFYIDCDDTTAKRIMLADNRTSDLAFYDDPLLVNLLREVQSASGSLDGTGYDDDAYALLLSQVDGHGTGNVVPGQSAGDRRDEYEASELRSFMLQYGNDEYNEMVDGLAALRSAYSVETNAEVVLILVRGATG